MAGTAWGGMRRLPFLGGVFQVDQSWAKEMLMVFTAVYILIIDI